MNRHEFFDRVTEHPDLEWVGVRSADGGPVDTDDESGIEVGVRHVPSGGISHAIAMRGIDESTWNDLESVLTCRRMPRVVSHVTRIVGYYSLTHSWNRSKLAELADRQAGRYVLEDVARPGPAFGVSYHDVPRELSLRVYGTSLCSRCRAVQDALEERGHGIVYRELVGEELAHGRPGAVSRDEQEAVMAAFAAQNGLLPVVLTWDLRRMVRQETIGGADREGEGS